MPLIQATAFCNPSLAGLKMLTSPKLPTSSRLIVVPVSRWISCMIFPCGPMTAPMNSLSMKSFSMRGAWGFFASARGPDRKTATHHEAHSRTLVAAPQQEAGADNPQELSLKMMGKFSMVICEWPNRFLVLSPRGHRCTVRYASSNRISCVQFSGSARVQVICAAAQSQPGSPNSQNHGAARHTFISEPLAPTPNALYTLPLPLVGVGKFMGLFLYTQPKRIR